MDDSVYIENICFMIYFFLHWNIDHNNYIEKIFCFIYAKISDKLILKRLKIYFQVYVL